MSDTLERRAMQSNLAAPANTRAADIWLRAGLEIVRRLPGVFRHPTRGDVDALVLYKTFAGI